MPARRSTSSRIWRTQLFVKLFSLWLGVDHGKFASDPNVSQVFDMKLSLNRRKKVNQDVTELTCAFAEHNARPAHLARNRHGHEHTGQ